MSWSGGLTVCINVWNEVREFIPENKRSKKLSDVIKILEDLDWGNPGELKYEVGNDWPELDEALKMSGWGE